MNWHTVCVYYFDTERADDLILGAIAPLFGELPGDAHFLRHWRRGPHVRLNFRATPNVMRHMVLPAVDTVVGGFLRHRPSTSTVDARALLPSHRRLAAAEHEYGQLWPWRADNSVHVEPYDSRAHVLGSPAAASLVADFYTAANDAAFAAVDRVRSGRQQRMWLAFDLMAATAHAFAAGGVRRGYVSFRAHAEVFLAGTAAPHESRADWDRRYSVAAEALRARLAAVVAEVDGVDSAANGAAPSLLGEWLAVLGGFRDRGYALVDSGKIRMESAPAGMRPPPDASPFLRELITNADFHRRLMPSPAFQRYRLLLNLLYLQLTRLGVRPVERYLLCHLAANAVEELYAVDAVESLRANARGDW